jgi:hypothetical protein
VLSKNRENQRTGNTCGANVSKIKKSGNADVIFVHEELG